MSEPINKPGHQPESYDPKDMPEIMRLAERAQTQAEKPSGGCKIIPGLSKVDFSDGGEYVQAVISALGVLGEKLDSGYVSVVSGTAFRTFIDKAYEKGGYNHGNYTIGNTMSMWTVEHTFRMLGYRASVHYRSNFETDKALIVRSIDRGVPVVTLNGIVDTSEACVITGYDRGGDVLLGHSAMWDDQDCEKDPTGCFRKSNWHKQEIFSEVGAIVIIEEKLAKPSKEAVYHETLRTAIRLIQGTDCQAADCRAYMGLRAHEAYADQMTRARQGRNIGNAYFNMMCNRMMYIEKKCAAPFFVDMGNEALAEIYRQIERLDLECNKIIPWTGNRKKLLKRPKRVAKFCDRLLAIRDLERQALEIMQAELQRVEA